MEEVTQEQQEVALILVEYIDWHLDEGSRHFRNKEGELLSTLDQVILAILNGTLEEASLGIS